MIRAPYSPRVLACRHDYDVPTVKETLDAGRPFWTRHLERFADRLDREHRGGRR